MAGRLTLNPSGLSAIPSSTMQTATLASSTCSAIDKLRRDYLWGETETKRVHLVSWDRVCQPKLNGGLGLRPAKDTNNAFLMKLSWEMVSNSQALWVEILKSKYGECSERAQASCLWKAIQKRKDQVRKSATWMIGMADRLNFGWTPG